MEKSYWKRQINQFCHLDIQEGRLIFNISRNGINSINNDISSGLLFGAKIFMIL